MKINISDYLKGEDLQEYTQEKPFKAVIRKIVLRKKEDLPFESKTDRYEIMIESSLGNFAYTANDTTLRNCKHVWGDETDNWIDKTLCLWTVLKDVFGKEKQVIFGAPEQKKEESG